MILQPSAVCPTMCGKRHCQKTEGNVSGRADSAAGLRSGCELREYRKPSADAGDEYPAAAGGQRSAKRRRPGGESRPAPKPAERLSAVAAFPLAWRGACILVRKYGAAMAMRCTYELRRPVSFGNDQRYGAFLCFRYFLRTGCRWFHVPGAWQRI